VLFIFHAQIVTIDINEILLRLYVTETFVALSIDDVFLYQQVANVERIFAAQLCWNNKAVKVLVFNGYR